MSGSIVNGDIPRGATPAAATSVARGVVNSVRSLAVIAVLAGAAYWGHTRDWKPPKFSELFGRATTAEAQWCVEHGVAEAECIECNVAMRPQSPEVGWCPVHGVAQCLWEHPEIAETKQAPLVDQADLKRVERALSLRPRAENNSRCKTHQRVVQFASHEAAEKAGVDVAIVDRGAVAEAITANGQLDYDQTRVAHLSSRVSGTVWQVRKQVGDVIAKGEVLALVDAVEVGQAKTDFMQSLAKERLTETNLARLMPLSGQGAVPERQLREASATHQESQIRLLSARQTLVNLGFAIPSDNFGDLVVEEVARRIQFLGIPAELTASWDAAATTSNLFPLRAALDGVVVERNAVEGEVVENKGVLFTIGDVGRMWLVLDVRLDDIELVQRGAPVRFRASDRAGSAEITGTVAWISTAADNRTRTVKVRVDLPNDGRLRANTFGTGRIMLREESDAIIVPSQAVHSDGCCQIVFVRDRRYFEPNSPKFYHVRKVRTGVKTGEQTEILAGLLPGEVIASQGSSVLSAQLMRSNLGAGCGCAH